VAAGHPEIVRRLESELERARQNDANTLTVNHDLRQS
jgi:hypothetical protein